ncbi:MAG: hypothetical protein L3J81_03045, partial [Thermoplasmata archaeon]|nr:hypothetical protein [Thermoplasmata archaeon]
MTLAASGATAGTYGSATQSLTATVDAKGRVTGVSANTVTPAWANITSNPFTVASGKTVVFSNTLTFAGTDSSTLNVGTGGTLGTAAYTAATAYQAVNTQLTNFAGLGNPGTSGYVLSSTTGGTLSWVAQSGGGGSGTVTSVAAGTGLTGGTITTSGTIGLSSAYAGNGIGTVNGLAWGNGSGTIGTVTLGSGGLSFSGGALSLASTLPSGVQANITAFGAATGTSLDGTPIGFTTPSTGAFTTLQASSTLGVTGAATLASTALVKGVLTVNLNGISAPGLTGLIGSLMAEFSPTNSNAAWVVEDSYGNIPLMALRRMDGTNGSPTPIQSGDFLGEFAIAPYDSLSTSYALSAAIIGTAAETWNGGHGTNLVFRTTQIGNPGAPSSRMELFASGGLALGSGILGTDPGAGNLSVAGTGLFAGVLSVSNTTAATSTTTGAITSAGGLGVAGQGWFGDDIHSAGATSNFSGTTTASSSTTGTVTIGNGTATTNVGIGGGAIVAGGVVTGVEGFTAGSSTLEGVLNLYDAGHTGHYLTLTCADTLS